MEETWPGCLPIAGEVLELACGTGKWTRALAARARVAFSHVRFDRADPFRWRPSSRYGTVFFVFFLSHVPPSRLDDGTRYRIVKEPRSAPVG